MRISGIIFLVCCFATASFAQQKLLSPEEFLGYALGERFTRHHRMIEYFRHVAGAVPNIKLVPYGDTYEQRPLLYAVITSPENFKDLEQIRVDNLRRAAMLEGRTSGERKAIVWLSYNVHGNEASSMEAAMATLYDLANHTNTRVQEWMKNTVVIIDPCVNPDGRDRYSNFFNQFQNVPANPAAEAYEHHEPWPNGRSNHYLFDLNRDWAWATQKESRQRLQVYHAWMPHVHVDFHEQGYDQPYYFAPAAEPFHAVVTSWQREFQTMIGKNHARYFDEHGWLYFTKEIFDLYYPSYGDTYPTYSGAIGMTYEQAGGGSGGLSITTKEGDPLTLKDRISHHVTTGLSTIEITSKHARRVVEEFEKYFTDNNHRVAGPYRSYVIKRDNNPDKISRLTAWMDLHKIRYGHPSSSRTFKAFDYQSGTTTTVTVSNEDIVVPADQPKSRFITTVFEPQSTLPDSLTYDITAWNLIYAYNLKAYAFTERISAGKPYRPVIKPAPVAPAQPYAYLFRYEAVEDVAFLAALLKVGIRVRCAEKGFRSNGTDFAPGTLIIPRRNNETVADFDAIVSTVATEMNREIFTASSGFVEVGKDVGSADVNYLRAPRVAMLFGEQTSSLNAGEIWYFFEQEINYPVTHIGTSYFRNVEIGNYDVLIVPDGQYRLFDEGTLELIASWVRDGGKLIIIGNGLQSFVDKKGFNLKQYTNDLEKREAELEERSFREKEVLRRYEDAERKQISSLISGAIYKVGLDPSHPLAFGLGSTYYSLKTNTLRFGFLERGWNVGVISGKAKPVQGFAGHRANNKLGNSLVFGVEEMGQGQVVYLADNPLFRSFWENGKLLFSNAVFMVGQ